MGDEAAGTQQGGPGRARVVVGVDGSEASQAALVWALEEARLRGAVLQVVHAWQFPFELAAGTYTVPEPAGDMQQWAEQVIDDALAGMDVDGSVDIVREAPNGSAPILLTEAARGADMLVVGTRGHSRLTGLFLGSTSQFLAVHAPCPVLVVHGGTRPVHAGAGGTAAAQPAASDPAPRVPAGAPGSPELLEIPEDECLALMAGTTVGRLVVVHDGLPQAYPVNYVLDGRTVAVRTDVGMLLDWATLGQVAFEVDRIDESTHEGWSVVVHGIGRDVTEGIDAWSQRLRARTLEPWAGGDRRHWIAIASPTFTGRRIVQHTADGAATAAAPDGAATRV